MTIKKFYYTLNKDLYNFSYILNFFLPAYCFIIAYLSGQYELSAQYSLILGFNQLILFSISGHLRNYFLSGSSFSIYSSLTFRIIVSVIFICFQIYLINFFELSFEKYFYIFFIIVINLSWIYEIVISYLEKSSNIYKNLFFLDLFSLIVYFFIALFNYELSIYILLIILIKKILILTYTLTIIEKKFRFFKPNRINFNLFASTISISFSGFLIRLMITNQYSFTDAAHYIFAFSVGTLLSTLYVNSLGINLIMKRRLYPIYFKIFISLYVLAFFVCILFKIINVNIISNEILEIWIPTSLGALILFKSQEIRLKFFVQETFRIKILNKDILISLIQIFFCYICLIFLNDYFNYYFLTVSSMSYLIFANLNYVKIKN